MKSGEVYLSVVRLLSCGRMAKTPHSVQKKPQRFQIHVVAFYKNISFRLFLFFLCSVRIVDGVMQSTAFLAFHSLTGNKVTHVYHVTKFAYFTRSFYTLKQTFCLFVQYIQTVPSTNQTDLTSSMRHPKQKSHLDGSKSDLIARCFSVRKSVFVK